MRKARFTEHQIIDVLPRLVGPQILPLLAGLADFAPSGRIGDGGDPECVVMLRATHSGFQGVQIWGNAGIGPDVEVLTREIAYGEE